MWLTLNTCSISKTAYWAPTANSLHCFISLSHGLCDSWNDRCKIDKGRARAKRQSSTPGIVPKAFEALLQQQPVRQTFCVQVYRQVKTDKCAKVTQQTQCLSFLEYKKKSNSWAYLGTETPPVFVFFCVFPLHFFLLKVTWICTRYGVEKNAVQKRNADEGRYGLRHTAN